ncbi:hypothetical protein ACFRMN_33040 [Streptomyces sp. NPDC056835]|uniref:hypothetical protein n=1 Tax=Streptomyces sp. NPDC056835 TaxID=3345956 RepID=UPI0036889275
MTVLRELDALEPWRAATKDRLGRAVAAPVEPGSRVLRARVQSGGREAGVQTHVA